MPLYISIFAMMALLAMDAPGGRTADADFRKRAAPPTLSRPWVELIASPEDEADPHPFIFRVHRDSHDLAENVVVRLRTRGTMTSGVDYVPPPQWIVIPRGRECADVNIFLIDDDEAEGPETIELVAERAT